MTMLSLSSWRSTIRSGWYFTPPNGGGPHDPPVCGSPPDGYTYGVEFISDENQYQTVEPGVQRILDAMEDLNGR